MPDTKRGATVRLDHLLAVAAFLPGPDELYHKSYPGVIVTPMDMGGCFTWATNGYVMGGIYDRLADCHGGSASWACPATKLRKLAAEYPKRHRNGATVWCRYSYELGTPARIVLEARHRPRSWDPEEEVQELGVLTQDDTGAPIWLDVPFGDVRKLLSLGSGDGTPSHLWFNPALLAKAGGLARLFRKPGGKDADGVAVSLRATDAHYAWVSFEGHPEAVAVIMPRSHGIPTPDAGPPDWLGPKDPPPAADGAEDPQPAEDAAPDSAAEPDEAPGEELADAAD